MLVIDVVFVILKNLVKEIILLFAINIRKILQTGPPLGSEGFITGLENKLQQFRNV